MDATVTFTLDRYEPVAFHTYPALMRPAQPTQVSEPEVATTTLEPDESVPVAAYLVGIDATAVLRSQLADFLDAAGARQDVRVSVGVSGGSAVEWMLRDAVPYGVRALPRYPADTSPGDPAAALEVVGTVLADDALSTPDLRRLVVLVWGRPPVPARLPDSLASAFVLHCVDVVLDCPPPDGQGPSWLLARSRPRSGCSLLAQAGRLLTGWNAFAEVPNDLVLTRLS